LANPALQIAEEVMNPLGIIGQYTDMIDYCQGQILTVLKLVALPSNQACASSLCMCQA
jgi:hypothetical protein